MMKTLNFFVLVARDDGDDALQWGIDSGIRLATD